MLIINVIKIISIINIAFTIFLYYIVVFITISIVLLLNEKKMTFIVRFSNITACYKFMVRISISRIRCAPYKHFLDLLMISSRFTYYTHSIHIHTYIQVLCHQFQRPLVL